ncbi:MAG: lipoate--protein ligase family protein [Gemmatimonadetes bacterium]|nr:lipoate--protein ligase family protein [Gemmatimonadota bacterium]
MAADYALLHAAAEGVAFLRLYRWNPACLSFGRNERAGRYDRTLIESLGFDTVRRPTGGRAVWHDSEVTYAVAAPVATFGGLRETYREIHAVIARAVCRLGVPARLAGEPPFGHPGPDAGACFASAVGGEVVVHGRKLAGSAQVREGSAFLQHGSILLADGQDLIARLTRGGPPRPPRPRAASLTTCLGRTVGFEEVADAVAAEARASWSGSWTRVGHDPTPQEAVSRFRDPAWTWRR